MRWIKKPKLNTDYKIVKRFALLPIRVNNEFRWLETCYIVKQRWYDFYDTGWANLSWTDQTTYLRWKRNRDQICHCADSSCKYNSEGEFCMLGRGAVLTNDGVCYSKERGK